VSDNDSTADAAPENGDTDTTRYVDPTTGEVFDTPTETTVTLSGTAAEDNTDSRCEAETTAGGSVYRCSLNEGHDGDHSFQVVEDEPDSAAAEAQASADEEQRKAMERAVRNYGRAIVGVLGADLGPFAICPCCHPSTPGLFIAHEHSDAEIASMRQILGLPDLTNYTGDRYARTCPDCSGFGVTLTGSRVPKHATIQCLTCKGRGYTSAAEEHNTPGQADPEGAQPVTTAADQQPAPMLPQAAQDALRAMLDAADAARAGIA